MRLATCEAVCPTVVAPALALVAEAEWFVDGWVSKLWKRIDEHNVARISRRVGWCGYAPRSFRTWYLRCCSCQRSGFFSRHLRCMAAASLRVASTSMRMDSAMMVAIVVVIGMRSYTR